MASSALQDAVDRFLAAPTPAHREAAVRASLPLVRSLVDRLPKPNHPLVTWEDLEGTALLALLQALDTYDPAHGTQFITHAYRRVRGALVDYLRQLDVLSRDRRQLLMEAHRAAETLRQQLGAEPSDAQVADALGVPLCDYHDLLADAHLRFTLSLSAPIGDEGEGALVDILEDEDGEAGFDAVERASVVAQLEHEIARLPERQRTILGLYYYEGLTLKQVGKIVGVTDARISQILGQTMLTLRGRLETVRPTSLAA